MTEILSTSKTKKDIIETWDLTKSTIVSKKIIRRVINTSKEKGFIIGEKVILSDDEDKEIGEIVAFNTCTIGHYTGDRFPIVVKFERGAFEYNRESLTLI
jgi:hypothetical protein